MPAKVSAQYTIASNKEWALTKQIMEAEKHKSAKALGSGFKLSRKNHPQLQHSFLLFYDIEGKEKLVSMAKHYYLGEGSFGRVKIVASIRPKILR